MGNVGEEVFDKNKVYLKGRFDLASALGVNEEVYLEVDSEVKGRAIFQACIFGVFFSKTHVQIMVLWGGQLRTFVMATVSSTCPREKKCIR